MFVVHPAPSNHHAVSVLGCCCDRDSTPGGYQPAHQTSFYIFRFACNALLVMFACNACNVGQLEGWGLRGSHQYMACKAQSDCNCDKKSNLIEFACLYLHVYEYICIKVCV